MKEENSKIFKVLCILGSLLLLIMALFHGSGYSFIKETMDKSNVELFLKEITPTLFIHPSIHLIGLAALGFLAMYIKKGKQKVLLLLSLFIVIDALLAFNLGGVVPGILLLASFLCFIIASLKRHNKTISS